MFLNGQLMYQQHAMSGPKRWVSSKVRKAYSKSSSTENIPLGNNVSKGTPPSPPTRIPSGGGDTADITFDCGSGSTILSRGSANNFPGVHAMGSSSSIDTVSTGMGLTPSPSTTPPKKTWERNYKSFLKKSSKIVPPLAADRHDPLVTLPLPAHKPMPRFHRASADNATKYLQPLLAEGDDEAPEEDLGPSLADGFHSHDPLTAPPSPSSSKDSSHKGGALFKRLRNKTKSHDCLDSTIRRGVDRKSPSNTPPGSCETTPRRQAGFVTQQRGEEKAAELQEQLQTPQLDSSNSGRAHRKSESFVPPVASDCNTETDTLDRPRHHGQTTSLGVAERAIFSRVLSLGCNLAIREGEPELTQSEQDELIRERKKAFTDFHNMGIDSTSAFLGGDDSSIHHRSTFLSSMAYPVGSAGGKAPIHYTPGIVGPHSMDRNKISPSTSMSSISGPAPRMTEPGEITPVRALRSFQGPEKWNKGERYAITPAVLTMLPITVLNHVMSKDDALKKKAECLNGSKQRAFGIGSIISEDDQDRNEMNDGWFFGEHHHVASGMLPFQRGGINTPTSPFEKVVLGKATVAKLGMRSFVAEVHGWCAGLFVLRQNFLFEYRESDSLNGLPWGYAMLQFAEAYPHKHFSNAFHLEYFERPCSKSGKRSLLMRVESREERDRWVSLLHSASRMTIQDLFEVDESDDGPEFGRGRYAVVRPAKRRLHRRGLSFSEARYSHVTSHDNLRSVASGDSLSTFNKSSNNDLSGTGGEYDCALKIIDKKEFWSRVKRGQERADTLVREVAIQTTLAVQGQDAAILRLRSIFETGDQLVMELELLKGTDLFQHISSQGLLDEVEAAHVMRDLLNCLHVMDRVGIAHRDIKPANLLMCDDNETGPRIKLADFGMASFVGVDNLVRGRCGTPGFVAPEILLAKVNGGYGNKVDMFSAGVTLYVMLVGYEPFFGESDEELINANRIGKVDFPHSDWREVSVEGRDLVERMLEVDPTKRIGPTEALRHPWITRRAPPII
ncbi:hypothetical protein ACHAWX_004643 [Stephanocyclus meneghinianus]